MTTIHNRNLLKLRRLLPDLDQLRGENHVQLVADGRVPLSVIVQYREDQRLLLTCGHYVEINGDVVPNPDMSLLVDLAIGSVRALSYQDLDRYIHRLDRVDWEREEAGLDSFLSLWLSNLHEQGYRVAAALQI